MSTPHPDDEAGDTRPLEELPDEPPFEYADEEVDVEEQPDHDDDLVDLDLAAHLEGRDVELPDTDEEE